MLTTSTSLEVGKARKGVQIEGAAPEQDQRIEPVAPVKIVPRIERLDGALDRIVVCRQGENIGALGEDDRIRV